jgi:L-ascorbate metabolism protein UlaG (beta-lactamase superfamily)
MVSVVSILLLFIVLPVVLYKVFTSVAPQFGGKPYDSKLADRARNSIYEAGKFKNQLDIPVILPKTYKRIIRMQFGKHPNRIPEISIPSVKPVFSDSIMNEHVSIIWLGHSSVLICIDGSIILTDTVFSRRPSPVSFIGPKPFKYSVPITPETIPNPDVILISHDHFDHLDYKTIKNYFANVKSYIVPLGVKSHLVRWGIPEIKIIELDWWSEVSYGEKLKFIATPAQHFTGRRGQNNSTLWCSWVIKGDMGNIFFCGDSGYAPHFKQIGEKYGPFDLTMMESGAYGQYWPYIHMIPEESVRAHIDLKGKVLLPIHWGKYNLAFHPWKEPVERLSVEATVCGIILTTPKPGEEIVLNEYLPQDKWWQNIN